jgi:hypothetical protein
VLFSLTEPLSQKTLREVQKYKVNIDIFKFDSQHIASKTSSTIVSSSRRKVNLQIDALAAASPYTDIHSLAKEFKSFVARRDSHNEILDSL